MLSTDAYTMTWVCWTFLSIFTGPAQQKSTLGDKSVSASFNFSSEETFSREKVRNSRNVFSRGGNPFLQFSRRKLFSLLLHLGYAEASRSVKSRDTENRRQGPAILTSGTRAGPEAFAMACLYQNMVMQQGPMAWMQAMCIHQQQQQQQQSHTPLFYPPHQVCLSPSLQCSSPPQVSIILVSHGLASFCPGISCQKNLLCRCNAGCVHWQLPARGLKQTSKIRMKQGGSQQIEYLPFGA